MEYLERLDAKAVISQSFVDVSRLLHDRMAEGYPMNREDGAALSLYLARHVKRIGGYAIYPHRALRFIINSHWGLAAPDGQLSRLPTSSTASSTTAISKQEGY